MMERLTYRGTPHMEEGEFVTPAYSDYSMRQIINKLAEYEDAEEQGLLLRLPCAEGTTVYVIRNNTDACADCRFFDKGYCCDDYCSNKNVKDEDEHVYPSYPQYADKPLCEKHFLEITERKTTLDWIYRNKNNFGKTVFLTKEEAEAALKNLQEQEDKQ